jgi:hypothetical protein
MPSRRKRTFPCGHTGQGQYCHRCQQEKTAKQEKADQRASWQALFEQDPIDLSLLPHKNLIKKARHILKNIQAGQSYMNFQGKRLNHNRNLISIPLNRDYRLLFCEAGGKLKPLVALSHEDYNAKKPGDTFGC